MAFFVFMTAILSLVGQAVAAATLPTIDRNGRRRARPTNK
jgi:hypothetical protein